MAERKPHKTILATRERGFALVECEGYRTGFGAITFAIVAGMDKMAGRPFPVTSPRGGGALSLARECLP